MFEAYKIGVRVALLDGMSYGLGTILSQVQRVHGGVAGLGKETSAVEAKLKSLAKTTLIGGALAGGGLAMLHSLKGPYEEAKKYIQAQTNFETLNLSAMENGQAYAKAADISHKVLGTTITGNVKAIHDLHTAFGDLHHAIAFSERFAQFSVSARVANGGKEVEGLTYAGVKALEHRGGKVINDDATADAELRMMSKVYFGSKGKVSPSDYFHASQTGKMAYTMFDKEYLYGQFAAYMQAKTGPTAGTAAMTAFSSLIGGHMDSKGKGFLADIGIWQEGFSKKRLAIMNASMKVLSPEERKTAIASVGGAPVIAGGLKDDFAERFAHRPDLFISDVMVPAIRKRFGMNLTDEQVALLISKNLNRNTSDFLGEHIVNRAKFAKDDAIFNKTDDYASAYQRYTKTPEFKEEALVGAWKNALTELGLVVMPLATGALTSLTIALQMATDWMRKYPNLTKALTGAFVVLAASMAFGGTVMLLSAGFSGLRLALSMGGGLANIFFALNQAVVAAGSGMLGIASKLGMVAVWGAIGYAIGDLVIKPLIDGAIRWITDDKEKNLGSFLHTMVHGEYDPNAKPKKPDAYTLEMRRKSIGGGLYAMTHDEYDPNGGSKYVRPQAKQPPMVQVHTTNYMDGRAISTTVSEHLAKDLSRPNAGIGGFDGGMALQYPGMNPTR